MKGELTINGNDAYTTWGVSMGDGFLEALDAPLPMKDYVENASRLSHGKSVLADTAKVDSREITLPFVIMGSSASDYFTKKRAFQEELQAGAVTVSVPFLGDEVFNLVYLGKSITYSRGRSGRIGTISVKFCEPDPTNRE